MNWYFVLAGFLAVLAGCLMGMLFSQRLSGHQSSGGYRPPVVRNNLMVMSQMTKQQVAKSMALQANRALRRSR